MTPLPPVSQRIGCSIRPRPEQRRVERPLKARMMNQAKERRISVTQNGMNSSRNSVGAFLGGTIFAR